ncbi:hypothetical protein MCHLDSM_01432 [Mycolicibacterium chlorophenolicum]|uniref:DUF7159 domain-containing protein n=2 Tax=Mycolicibacterium chlorophenolicum TaxID=37916 RepID=A0A0J6WG75_9MYCO|nr:hypothetical protein MCHLDSM_01432 [Mycolicibacterium chlorophenolicum]
MRVVMGLSLTAKSAVWALVDTKDGTILADEVVTLDSANEIARAAARSIQSFALQSERDIDGVRMTWSEDARAHGIRLRTKLRLFGFETVETVSQDAAREGRNRTARHIAPHLVLAYGAARADMHGDDHRNMLVRLVSRVPVAMGAAAAAGVAVVAGVGIYALTGGFSATTPVTDAAAPAPAPAPAAVPPVAAPAPAAPMAAPVAQPVEAAPPTAVEVATVSPEETPEASAMASVDTAVPTASLPTASLPSATDSGDTPSSAAVPQVATVQDVQEVPAATAAAAGITAGEPQTLSTMIGEPHLTGSQLAAGPVQAVVAPVPVAAGTTPTATTPTPTEASNGPLSVFLGALP